MKQQPDAAARTAAQEALRADLADAVRYYLQQSPRQLPSRLLYDPLGSAIFDAICLLPWYRVTRAELGLLERHASTIGRALGRNARVVELGSGSGEKIATLIANAGFDRVRVDLIDVSGAALARSAQALAALYDVDVTVTPHEATYEEGLLSLRHERAQPTMAAFLGSNIGNFDEPGAVAFVRLIRSALRPGDYLLLGADLVKPERDLLLAYDDPLGITAAFNKNLLLRINRELSGNFQLDRFAHRAVWNSEFSRVEMHLDSRVTQDVEVAGCGLQFTMQQGETIWTESSYKYEPHSIAQLLEPAGFAQREQWIDEDARFALTFLQSI